MSEATQHRVIRASAGAGKTHALSSRYLALLRRGAQPGGVLATTFTRKASAEILGRVLMRLADAASDARAAAELGRELNDAGFGLPDARRLLDVMTRSMHRVSVSTIDSFFNQMAMAYRYELGLPAAPRLIDDAGPVAQQLRRRAIDAMLADDDPQVLAAMLRRLHHDQEKRRISATLDELFVSLYDVYRETDAAAWHRLEEQETLDEAALAEAVDALRRAGDALPSDKRWVKAWRANLAATTAQDWKAFLSGGLSPRTLDDEPTYHGKPFPGPVLDAYRPLVEHAMRSVVNLVARQTHATYDLLARFDAHYTRLRREQGVLLFSDLPRLLMEQAERELGLDELYFRLDAQVQHLLLDEFQDTSPTQWRILRPFALEVTSHAEAEGDGPARTFFCVGDVKQSIYGWRGGCAEVFDRVVSDLHLPASCVSTTSVSYRSSQVVLDVVNRVFDGIARAPALAEVADHAAAWGRGYEPHKAHHAQRRGYVELAASPTPPEETDADDEAPSSHLLWSAERITDLAHQHPSRTIGVLVRTNRAAARLLPMLRWMGVQASGEGGAALDDEPAVELVLSAMTMADHPGNTAAVQHVLDSPLAEVLVLASRDARAADGAARGIRRALIDEGYAAVIGRWARTLAPRCNRRGVERLTQLIEMAEAYDPAVTLRCRDFVDHVRTTRVEDPTPARVRVMTVHKAKGLQFDVVVLCELGGLIGTVKGLTWSWRDDPTAPPAAVFRSGEAQLRHTLARHSDYVEAAYDQEKRRRVSDDLSALYVAMTRARHALHLFVEPLRRTRSGKLSSVGLTNASAASVLRQRLTDVDDPPIEGELFTHGDPAWDEAREAEAPAPPALAPVRLALDRDAATRSWAVVTPSSLEDAGRVDARRLLDLTTHDAMSRGRDLHELMEKVAYVDELDEAGADPRLRDVLRRPTVREALTRRDAREELWRERAFAVRDGDRLMRGVFDRVAIERDSHDRAVAARLIDFKTDAFSAATVERYRPQMEAYRRALGLMLGLDVSAVEAVLLFVDSDVAAKV